MLNALVASYHLPAASSEIGGAVVVVVVVVPVVVDVGVVVDVVDVVDVDVVVVVVVGGGVGAAAAMTLVGADVATVVPFLFVAVTVTRKAVPRSAEAGV